jgi:polar amino acid transport system substrate-binding protein
MSLTVIQCAPAPQTIPDAAASPSAQESKEVVLATGEWTPYVSETMEGYGAFAEIVSAAFKEMGVPVKYVFSPWKRAEGEVYAGEAFAAFPYIKTEERLKKYDYSDPVMPSTGVFFYMPNRQKSKITYEKLEDLKSYRVGGVLGYWYEEPFKQAGL